MRMLTVRAIIEHFFLQACIDVQPVDTTEAYVMSSAIVFDVPYDREN